MRNMGDIVSDTEAQLCMMMNAYKALREQQPDHELLKLATVHKDEGGFDFTAEFGRRCIADKDRWRVHGYARYTLALEAAVKGEPIRLLDTDPPCSF